MKLGEAYLQPCCAYRVKPVRPDNRGEEEERWWRLCETVREETRSPSPLLP